MSQKRYQRRNWKIPYDQMKIEMKHIKIYGMKQKTVLRGEFIMVNTLFKKQEKPQINNLTLHLKELEEEQMKPKLVEGKK